MIFSESGRPFEISTSMSSWKQKPHRRQSSVWNASKDKAILDVWIAPRNHSFAVHAAVLVTRDFTPTEYNVGMGNILGPVLSGKPD